MPLASGVHRGASPTFATIEPGQEIVGAGRKALPLGGLLMILLGIDFLEPLTRQAGFSAKMVFNDAGAIFFPAHLQHRDQKAALISYEDDYAGNALAAMLAPGHIEIRYHRDFTDGRVLRLAIALLSEPKLAFMRGWRITYQGRTLPPTD